MLCQCTVTVEMCSMHTSTNDQCSKTHKLNKFNKYHSKVYQIHNTLFACQHPRVYHEFGKQCNCLNQTDLGLKKRFGLKTLRFPAGLENTSSLKLLERVPVCKGFGLEMLLYCRMIAS